MVTSSESDETFDMDSVPEQLDIELLSSSNPVEGTEGASELDLQSNQTLIIQPNTQMKIDMGMHAAISDSHCGLLVSRRYLAVMVS